jgi:hypothetical protein
LPDAAEDIGLVYTTAVNGIGEILRAEPSHNNDKEDQTESFGSSLVKYRSLEACKAHDPVQTWPCRQPVKQVAAFDVGFVILYADGSVATLGDPRYEDCLGREVDDAKLVLNNLLGRLSLDVVVENADRVLVPLTHLAAFLN